MLHSQMISPQEEDHALFAHPLGQCEVALIPKYATSKRGEHVIHGYLQRDSEVEVLFSGRRKTLAEPLMQRLNQLLEHAKARGIQDEATLTSKVRLRAAVYGSWRSRFTEDYDGCQTKRMQLVAAIWRIYDESGRPITRGSAPLLGRSKSRVV